MRTISACPVCKSGVVHHLFRREGVLAHQNVLMPDRASARRVPRGTLDLALCEECGFIFNRSFDPEILGYGERYDNAQECSQVFRDYLTELVNEMVWQRGVRNCRVIEVGCGKGWFLRQLVTAEGAGNVGYGFDPSYVGPSLDLDGRLRFERHYYDKTRAGIRGDVVICRHVLEHVPDPVCLLSTIRAGMHGSPDGRLFLETPCVDWILSRRVVWDFFYEHCSYFSAASIATALEASGFRVEEVRHLFGGQYLWVEAIAADGDGPVSRNPGATPSLAKQFAVSDPIVRSNLNEQVHRLLPVEGGELAVWGAGAKGVTFTNFIDPERELIACIADLNPRKQGHCLPGTGHPIVSPLDLPRYGVVTAILMNPNYRAENLQFLQEARLTVSLVDLME